MADLIVVEQSCQVWLMLSCHAVVVKIKQASHLYTCVQMQKNVFAHFYFGVALADVIVFFV